MVQETDFTPKLSVFFHFHIIFTRALHGCWHTPAPVLRVGQRRSWNCSIRHKQNLELKGMPGASSENNSLVGVRYSSTSKSRNNACTGYEYYCCIYVHIRKKYVRSCDCRVCSLFLKCIPSFQPSIHFSRGARGQAK